MDCWPAYPVADPGFPVGGVDLVGGGGGVVDSRGGYISKILCVKMKESGPLWGRAPGRSLDPSKISTMQACLKVKITQKKFLHKTHVFTFLASDFLW